MNGILAWGKRVPYFLFTIWIYDVSAVAQTAGSPGDPGYVERVISVKMGK